MLQPIDPFDHPLEPTQPQGQGYGNHGRLENVAAINIGSGDNGFYVTREGMWIGAQKFAKAPFSVDPNGRATFQDQLGQTVIDSAGIKSDTQFLSSTVEDFTDRTSSIITPRNIDFTTLSFFLTRQTNVIIDVSVSAYVSGLTGGDAGAAPTGIVQLAVDGVLAPYKLKVKDVRLYTPEINYTQSREISQTYNKLVQLAPGPHTINLVMYLLVASAYVLHITETSLTYITLGK